MIFLIDRRKVLIRLAKSVFALGLVPFLPPKGAIAIDNKQNRGVVMKLPQPKLEGSITVERAIRQRRTIRVYSSQILDLDQLSQLLWSAQGLTGVRRFKRAAPSAGALYPMDVYAVVGQNSVVQLDAGVYHYEPRAHGLSLITQQDLRDRVARAAISQMWMSRAPINLVITAEYKRVTGKYGKRGIRYAQIEAGHIGQNLFLQAEALGLRAGIVGAFRDKDLIEIMKLPRSHEPLLIMPVGYPDT
jgi:SagB-type dehydrogenase family enzyme